MNEEHRMGDAITVETRQENGQEVRYLVGTALRFDDVGEVSGMFKEKFLAGSLEMRDVEVNVMHQRDRLLGRSPGNVELRQSEKDLQVAVRVLDTQEHRDAVTNIEAGVLRGWSVEFVAKESRFAAGVREIRKAVLKGIGLVAQPVYSATTVAVRDEYLAAQAEEERQKQARSAGMNWSMI